MTVFRKKNAFWNEINTFRGVKFFDDQVANTDALFENDSKVVGVKEVEKNEDDDSKCECDEIITEEILKSVFLYKGVTKIFSHSNMKNYDTYKTEISDFILKLKEVMRKYEINNCLRKAHFLAQIWWETDRFNTLEEYASGNGYNPNEHQDARKNLNTQMGDGPLYKGRGCMQLTWKLNYKNYGKFIDEESFILTNPKEIANNLNYAIDSAGWFWNGGKTYKNGSIVRFNKLADQKRTDLISTYVNGGGNGKKERRTKTNELIKIFKADDC